MFRRALVPLGAILTFVVLAGQWVYGAEAIIPSPPQISADSYLLIDADTGKVIVEKNSEQRVAPASLTKIMTSYLAALEVERGVITLEESVDVSVKAWQMDGSKMFIREGTKVKLEDLLRGIIVQSGNDASVAIAEHIAGTEDAFAEMMNEQAERLGMENTHFVNATGWPSEDHYTTAADLAKLVISLINDYPEHYEMYKEKYFTFNNIRQPNRNSLLWRDSSVDGVKTGHTEEAGFCLVASAVRDDMRLISIVLNTDSEEARARESQKLLTYGFRYFDTVHLYEARESLNTVRVWHGTRDSLDLGVDESVVVTLPRGSREDLSAAMDINSVIKAPVEAGQPVGKLTVNLDDEVVYEGSLITLQSVEQAGFFSRLWDAIMLFFVQLFGGDPLAV